jgi:hypothetical protein
MNFGTNYSELKNPNCVACKKEVKPADKLTVDRKLSKLVNNFSL